MHHRPPPPPNKTPTQLITPQASLPVELPPGKSIPVVSRLKTTAAVAALWGVDPEAEGPAAAARARDAEEGVGERPGLHVCSDVYFKEDGAVVDGGEGKKRGLEPEAEAAIKWPRVLLG